MAPQPVSPAHPGAPALESLKGPGHNKLARSFQCPLRFEKLRESAYIQLAMVLLDVTVHPKVHLGVPIRHAFG